MESFIKDRESDNITIFQVLYKTFSFILLRFFVVVMTILPIILLTTSFADFFFRLFGIQAHGIVYTVFYLNFAFIGFTVGLFVFGFLSKTLLFYIKIAHVIAITKICTDDECSYLFFTSIKEVIRHFLSVNLFYVADRAVLKGIHSMGEFLVKKEAFSVLDENAQNGKLKKLCLNFLGKTISKTLNYCDELVLSYVYVQWRVSDIYHSDDTLSRKDKIQQSLKYVVDGICLYIKNCMSLMKSSFYVVLTAEIFSWVISLFVVFLAWILLSKGVLVVAFFFIFSRIVYLILSYAMLEAYETIALVTTFYNVLYDSEEEIDFASLRNKLTSISPDLSNLITKAFGEDNLGTQSGSVEDIIDGNLFDTLKSDILHILRGDSDRDGR